MFREEVSKGEARPEGQATGWWLQRRGGCEAVFNMETLTRTPACGRCGATWATAGSGYCGCHRARWPQSSRGRQAGQPTAARRTAGTGATEAPPPPRLAALGLAICKPCPSKIDEDPCLRPAPPIRPFKSDGRTLAGCCHTDSSSHNGGRPICEQASVSASTIWGGCFMGGAWMRVAPVMAE